MNREQTLFAKHEWINWFDDSIRTEIQKILTALTPMFLGHPISSLIANEEPSGYDKISRRGNYDNLLLSELALSELMPDEFIRKATESELLFLTQGKTEQKNSASIILLLDAGPQQLGAPRIAHIAIWLLLIMRAEKYRAKFYWGIVQSPNHFSDERSTYGLRNLLKARTFLIPNDDQLAEWGKKIQEYDIGNSEAWVVSNNLFKKPDWINCQISIMSDFEQKNLHLTKLFKNNNRQTTISIPPINIATRLLQGYFLDTTGTNVHQRTDHKISLQQPPIFSPDGKYIAVGMLDGGALVYRIPNSSDQKQTFPNAQKWMSNQQLMAATLNGKKLSGLLCIDSNIHFWQVKGANIITQLADTPWSFTHGRPQWNSMFIFYLNHSRSIFFMDSKKSLFFHHSPDGKEKNKSKTTLQLTNVIQAMQVSATTLVVATKSSQHSISIEMYVNGSHKKCYLIPNTLKSPGIFFCGQEWPSAKGTFAIEFTDKQKQDSTQHWKVYKGASQFSKFTFDDFIFPSTMTVHGLILSGAGENTEPLLIATNANNNEIHTISKHGTSLAIKCSYEILRINLNSPQKRLAIISGNRQLMVYDLNSFTLILSSTTDSKS